MTPAATEPIALSRQGRRITAVTERVVGIISQRTKTLDIDFVYGINEPDPQVLAAIRASMKWRCARVCSSTPSSAGDEGSASNWPHACAPLAVSPGPPINCR